MIKRTVDNHNNKSMPIMDLDASNTYAIFAVNDRTMGNSLDRLYLYNITTNAWSEINATGLPANYITNCIKNIGNNNWLLATNGGLYHSTNGGSNWAITHNASDWQQGITVSSIQFINNKVFLGTLANGIWEEDLTTGLITPFSNNDISVYPNPATEGFYIEPGEKTTTVSVYNLNGSMTLSKVIIGKSYINVSNLVGGLYIVKITTDGYTVERKLVKK